MANNLPPIVQNLQARAKAVAGEDLTKVQGLVNHAYKSQSYLYPLKGVVYFATRPTIWKPLLREIMPMIGLSVVVVGAMFFLTYLPQMSLLFFVNGPFAVFTAAMLVLNESSTIINILARQWVLQQAIVDTFDSTLLAEHQQQLVAQGRELRPGADPMRKLGRILMNPFAKFSPNAIIRYFMYLPLNFIPIVGTALFILVQARARGNLVHGRYFQLKRWSTSQQNAYLEQNKAPYTGFGIVATLLEMVPLASPLFAITNTVGAALWAADLEKDKTTGPGPVIPGSSSAGTIASGRDHREL